MKRRIFRLANIMWQSALPPTLCTVFYIRFSSAHQKGFPLWMPIFQQMIETLRSFAILHHVRRLDISRISVIHTPFLTHQDRPTYNCHIDSHCPRLQNKWDGRPSRGVIGKPLVNPRTLAS
ncbi:hypothetical protein EDB83DRAFT_2378668 [Lactarius deliciosus]|nr:hypothetical protein EDB83DRAFT_2378668 [Lactarius deliciosus]